MYYCNYVILYATLRYIHYRSFNCQDIKSRYVWRRCDLHEALITNFSEKMRVEKEKPEGITVGQPHLAKQVNKQMAKEQD